MTQIIPAINAKNFEEIESKIKIIEPISDWAHIDAADGSFTPNILWRNPSELARLKTSLNIEVHLMIMRPEEYLQNWLVQNIKRLIVNIETSGEIDCVIHKCAEKKKGLGLSVSPPTEVSALAPYFKKINFFQILAVMPGKSGQNFDTNSLEKIRELKTACPDCVIEVDGGINPATAKAARGAGADILVSSSYVFSGDNVEKRIDDLKSGFLIEN